MIPNFGADDGVDPLAAHDRAGWLALGRFSPEKGFEQLLQSWPESHHLDIIGNGDEVKNVCALAAQMGVKVESSVSREELRERLPRYFGLVFPSRWLEVAPQVVVEAMRVGLPVVAYEANGVSELVRSTDTGMSYEDRESLKQALDRTLEDLDGFSQRAIDHYRLRWRPSVWLDSMTGLYEDLKDQRL
jgi:glycosyltransferase involved in cell wall biosynthesis